jgi:hypothetical protein
VQCLNDMVTNALIHVDDCLQYMSGLKDNTNFRFCAIPQVHYSHYSYYSLHILVVSVEFVMDWNRIMVLVMVYGS